MPMLSRHCLKAAHCIRTQLEHPTLELAPPEFPLTTWKCLRGVARRLEQASAHGWHLAARIQLVLMRQWIEDFQRSLSCMLEELQDRLSPRSIPTETELYWELVALQNEYYEVDIDVFEHLICVTTESIVLEGIDLGRFQIRLDWRRLHSTHPYKIIALDPNPAMSNDAVSHPHVNNELLCEGDGGRSLRLALCQGRLCDFFAIVDRLLHTYAQGSAFVELNDWQGALCHECGSILDQDDYVSCDHCEELICPDCAASCSACDQTICGGCSASCRRCDQVTCASCLDRCRSCGSHVCPDCRTQDLCNECHEKQPSEEDPSQAPQSQGANPEVLPVRVGQTPVSA